MFVSFILKYQLFIAKWILKNAPKITLEQSTQVDVDVGWNEANELGEIVNKLINESVHKHPPKSVAYSSVQQFLEIIEG